MQIVTALANAGAMVGRVRPTTADHSNPIPAEAIAKTTHTTIAVIASSLATVRNSCKLPFVPTYRAHRRLGLLPNSRLRLAADNPCRALATRRASNKPPSFVSGATTNANTPALFLRIGRTSIACNRTLPAPALSARSFVVPTHTRSQDPATIENSLRATATG
jgi:hypothetical protein